MPIVNIHQAKTNLSKLVAEALEGGDVIIARNNRAAVRLVPVESVKTSREPGRWKGRVSLDEGFWEPLPEEELRLWNGEGD
jgi:prevent-host-death family protein